MKKLIYGCSLGIFLGGMLFISDVNAASVSVNEDELFSGKSSTVVEKKTCQEADAELRRFHLGLSGEINTDSEYFSYDDKTNWVGSKLEDTFKNTIASDLFLDLRFKNGIKSFVSVGAYYYPEGEGVSRSSREKIYHDALLKECFIDANLKGRIYFRAGKQVLKWGRGYFWNPVDLLNIEKKSFYDLSKTREGSTGLKVHIPFGVKQNVYIFAGAKDADDIKEIADVAVAGKYEWLVGNTEMALSGWYKDQHNPEFGYDFSTRFGKVDYWGELSARNGDDKTIIVYDKTSNTCTTKKYDDWYAQASLGFTRYFSLGDIKDRIMLTGECFYNEAGYSENIYQQINKLSTNIISGPNQSMQSLAKTQFLSDYQPFSNSKYYLAFFSSLSKFIIPELTLNFNGVTNLVDNSVVLTTGLRYKPTIKNWSVELNGHQYFGDAASEAKLTGQNYSLDLGITVLF